MALCGVVALLKEMHRCGIGFEISTSAEEIVLLGPWKRVSSWLRLDKDAEHSASSLAFFILCAMMKMD